MEVNRTMKSIPESVLTAALVLLALPSQALAYLDPGTGSMVLQIAIGGILAILATSKLYWHKLVSLFRGKPKDSAGEGLR